MYLLLQMCHTHQEVSKKEREEKNQYKYFQYGFYIKNMIILLMEYFE